ncbi:MAG: alkylhydroperoxidase AhpD family core protein 7 [Xanthobacteraceae bacterium]|jgi:alkylhydroperoxidase family enzyme|nr:alkylhydroperoxidase AhpD family core protein 7 [Xanthobacteraceae bacterium]
MARIPYVDGTENPELADLIGRISAGRRGNLINVYRLLLHSPALTESWFEHLNAVRWRTGLSGRLRELLIIRIALINRVAYVIAQHVPKLALADGVSLDECEALKDWQASDLFGADERAALAYADAMTKNVHVPDDVFEALREHFDDKAIVELSVLIGTYNMHNRVMQALDIDLETTR